MQKIQFSDVLLLIAIVLMITAVMIRCVGRDYLDRGAMNGIQVVPILFYTSLSVIVFIMFLNDA